MLIKIFLVKAYDGKGAKVLPILAKLQAKYESMNDEDKSKVRKQKFESYLLTRGGRGLATFCN